MSPETPYTKEEAWLLKEKHAGVPNLAFEQDCARLRSGEPLAYVIGFVPFLGTTIYLDSHPLIPRAETEHWVKEVIETLETNDTPLRVLDLCAGSGCIGTALLKAHKAVAVDFVEIDTTHHDTILRNVRENGIDAERAHIYGGDLFEQVGGEVYDLILSNPPYINPDAKERVEESVLAHEPHQALFGGEGGMALIRHIIEEAREHLPLGGSLYIEHEPEQTEAIAELARAIFRKVGVHKDQYGRARVTHLRS